MAKIPFYKIGSALKQNGKIDPNSGKAINGEYKTYTDSVTGEKTKIEYEKGDLGRTYKDAWDKRDMKTYGDMKLEEYTDFSKKQKAHYRTTGVWATRDEINSMSGTNTIATNGGNTKSNGNSDGTTTSSGGETGKTNTSNANNDENGETSEVVENGTSETPKGLIRKFESGKGFSGDVLDEDIAKNTSDAKSIRKYSRTAKQNARDAGATRREAKHHKVMAKALGFAQNAGMNLTERDAKGNIANQSIGEKSESGVSDGKARRKANRLMRRANRIAHRMKDYEGHNVRKNEVGGQYYGKGDVYNQAAGTGDGRNAQLRVSSNTANGALNTIKGIVNGNKNNNKSGSNNTTPISHGSGLASKFKNVAGTGKNYIGNKKQNGTV